MSKNIDKNIKNMIRAIIIPKLASIRDNFITFRDLILRRRIVITGTQASGEFNMSDLASKQKLDIDITILDDGHTHTNDQVEGSVQALPNTIVARDINSHIVGSGSTYGNTGFKLSNGDDVSTLFLNSEDRPLQCRTSFTGGGGQQYITNIEFVEESTNKILLTYNAAAFCPVYRHSSVKKDGC